ncbi:hypothetical protein BGX28_002100, partial [Mortierella sp. GBA30]
RADIEGSKINVAMNAWLPELFCKLLEILQKGNCFPKREPSSDYLTINLESNLLTAESFDVESLVVNGRITTLKLGKNPNLQVLKDSVFMSFLINTGRSNPNELDTVDLEGGPL